MKERLKIEDLESFNYNKVLDNVLEQIKLLEHQQAFDHIIKALNHYRELDIGEIRELIDDTESRSKLLDNQDVILFLGPTGCGIFLFFMLR